MAELATETPYRFLGEEIDGATEGAAARFAPAVRRGCYGQSVVRDTLRHPHTVTFDCWATLIYERGASRGHAHRVRTLAETIGVSPSRVQKAFDAAWREHQIAWHRRMVFDGTAMTGRILDNLGVSLDADARGALVEVLESLALHNDIRALPGARDALERLERAGVRRALICDTGFTPGRVVRKLLDRVGLLEFLEVAVFSDEVGVPKPHPRAFETALGQLGVQAEGAVHVGDLRRSDIAGARASSMGSIRLSAHHDDRDSTKRARAGVIDCAAAGCEPACKAPEADAVAGSFRALLEILGYE